MEVLIVVALLGAGIVVFNRLHKKALREQLAGAFQALGTVVTRHFLTQPCSRCHEYEMRLLSVSPNARSIHYQCASCGKKMHAAATSPEASAAAVRHQEFNSALARYESWYRRGQASPGFLFYTPEAPLPFERTTREPISEAVRTEVWRRDGGRCVTCGSNQQLEYDHIIPVSKGGGTSARNLQILCKGCNLKKGAKV